MNPKVEPKEAFPYKPPTKEIKKKYQHIFALKEPLEIRFEPDGVCYTVLNV